MTVESQSAKDPWADFSKEPVLPVPPFVTHEWLAPKVAVNYGLLKEVHKGRDEIQRLSGYLGWPGKQPSFNEFVDLLIEGFRYPSFIRAVTRVAARHVTSARKRESFHLFKPFVSEVRYAISKAANALGREKPKFDGDELCQMADAGYLDVALGWMFLSTLGFGARTDWLIVARKRPDQFGSLMPFLEATEQYLQRGHFNWKRDVVGLHHATTAVHPTDNENATGRSGEFLTPKQVPLSNEASNETNEPNPGTDSSSAARDADIEPEGQDASRKAWNSALVEAVRVARAAIAREPDREVLSQLVATLKMARSAQKAWEHSRPILVDTIPLVDEMREIATRSLSSRSTLLLMCHRSPRWSPPPSLKQRPAQSPKLADRRMR